MGTLGFLALCRVAGVPLPIPTLPAILGLAVLLAVIFSMLGVVIRREGYIQLQGVLPIAALAIVATITALAATYQLSNYLMLPVDLLSFSESSFIGDIIKLRLGVPIYSLPSDNNNYPYTPGTQILTYLISSTLGSSDSIPFFRIVQFSYVALAAVVATSVSDLLARKFLSSVEYRHRSLWITAWLPVFFLLVTEPRFNEFTHSLHNDGLALLLAICAFWLIVKHSIEPRPWVLGCMIALPALGFMVKQSQLVWGGVFFIYLLATPHVSWRQLLCYSLCCVMVVAATLGTCYLLWGDHFLFWTFVAIGEKSVSILRSALHLLQAGMYAIMGLFGGWVLVLRGSSRAEKTLWVCWLLVFGIEAYTSGLGWNLNHLGPGVVIAGCWFFPALVKVWPTVVHGRSLWEILVKELVAASAVVLLLGGLGLVWIPRDPIPRDFFRYVNEIEKEFVGFSPEKVLMDTGNWIYLKNKILMKDRSDTVGIWVGMNQEINHAVLAETIKRIQQKTYDKILARQLDTILTPYGWQGRGSGVKEAILENYQLTGRIAAVQGIQAWWPLHLVSEVLVYVPRRKDDALVVSPRAAQ